ncbi:MAG: ubiquinone/menaquinone biosynthesis methyltransferase [Thermoplasmatota archaeon]
MHEMFDAIAPRYDLLNRIVSLRMDARWRRRAVSLLAPNMDGRYLDVGAGTGDLAAEVAKRARVVGVDLARAMLRRARTKTNADLAQANGLRLPFRDASFAGATNAFVLRNVADADAFFREMRRVVVPGGRVVSLEISRPTGRFFGPLYRFYFFRVMPRVGRAVSGHREAYTYLAKSVEQVEAPESFAQRAKRAGFANVRVERMMRGAVALIVAE